MEFQGDFLRFKEYKLYEDGDGTVSITSLKYCSEWADEQAYLFKRIRRISIF